MQKNKKIITITEGQMKFLVAQMIAEETANHMQKALTVKKFLDDNFKRADISKINSEGYAESVPIVVYLDAYTQPIKNLTDEDLLDMLMDKFKNMFDNENERRSFLLSVMKAWYAKDKKLELGLL